MARFDLGLSKAEFFGTTPRELHELLLRKEHDDYRLDLRAGIIASTIANFNIMGSKTVFKPSDFMPFQKPELEAPKSPEELSSRMREIAAAQNARKEDIGD